VGERKLLPQAWSFWGSWISGDVRAICNELLYTGRRLDPETGLQLNRNRFYHQQLGRWVNRDPWKYFDSMNLYQYVGGMPVDNADPAGLAKGIWNTICEAGRGCWSVGPWDAWDAGFGDTADDARDFGRNNGKDKKGCSESNALRHCYWQARLTMQNGSGPAKSIGDAHEYGEDSCDSKKDQYNNGIGRGIGSGAKSITDIEKGCLAALKNGNLAVCDDDFCDDDDECDDSSSSSSDSSSGDSSDGSSEPYTGY